MIDLDDDFTDLLVAFADEDAEFMVVGGWALALHGYGRGTDDLDVWVRASPENAPRVYRALQRFGAPVDAHGIVLGDFEAERYGYRFGVKPKLIEVLTTISGIRFDDAWSRRLTFDLQGRRIPYLDRSALLTNKRSAGRPKDLADIAWLEAHPNDDD